MTKRITIDVPVRDVAGETRFCREGLGAMQLSPEDAPVSELTVGKSVRLRICDEASHEASPFDQASYRKGHGPRMELRVADVPSRVARAVAAGARLLSQHTLGDEEGRIAYAEIIDPEGHVWTFALEGS